jgi:hypothetical protein
MVLSDDGDRLAIVEPQVDIVELSPQVSGAGVMLSPSHREQANSKVVLRFFARGRQLYAYTIKDLGYKDFLGEWRLPPRWFRLYPLWGLLLPQAALPETVRSWSNDPLFIGREETTERAIQLFRDQCIDPRPRFRGNRFILLMTDLRVRVFEVCTGRFVTYDADSSGGRRWLRRSER